MTRVARSWLRRAIGGPLLVSLAIAASAQTVPERNPRPSKLDYLVLASLADSSNMLAMSAYREAAPPAAVVTRRQK